MSWIDRLKKTIVLTSPTGQVFEGKWAGNSISAEKKLGIFEYPNIIGTLTQDIGVTGTRYPLTIYFDGPDNDIISIQFMKALTTESGPWLIIHPVLGSLSLQLTTTTGDIGPVESGGLTKFDTEWIEALDSNVTKSIPELASDIINQAIETNTTAAEQAVSEIKQDTASEKLATELAVNGSVVEITDNLKSLYETVPELNAQITSIVSAIQDTITQTTIDILALAGEIQTLVQLPATATTDIESRLTSYTNMILDVIGLLPSGTKVEDKNIVSVQELTLSAAIVAIAQISSSGSLDTRNQAILAAATISDQFTDITNALDNVQDNFIYKDIDLQYFSQSASFSDASIIIGEALEYLLLASYELKIEKRLTMAYPRAPIEVTVTEYGTLGLNDENFDLFIASNKLKNNELLILPANKEVVVYVS